MPNLDKIFNKFYPQSQTGSKGKFLLNMAWTVEILVAIIGICIAIIVIINAQGTQNLEDLAGRSIRLNDITFGGIFFIVAIVELTKIPLATAVYYSVRIYWKVIFLIGLLLVNVSTFETIVTGFERINRERTKIVDKKIVKYHSINVQIEQLNDNTNVKQFDGEINELRKQRTNINKQISDISVNGQKRTQDISCLYQDLGQFYIAKYKTWKKEKKILCKGSKPLILNLFLDSSIVSNLPGIFPLGPVP